ncbi:dihydrolipoamide acetyltransferase family protein [Microbacterium schleiferi]|uniref:dihydrolipoamide acetyltransferase family protein n=1 Tax=Microbacterium schleiferi TaxID=69362 RepID=UPI001D179411|nr:dihydrolipoamide acetyltransferase family protein [Microbacterium schleiferi]MCC4266325.1 2-oxo acid dehydrogenase subunit E2 [Microbacterium schleiferi]
MATVIRMPEIATGTGVAAVQSWLVAVGDEVAQGQPIAEIETEKAVVEYEAEEAGVVAALLIAEGESTAVGSSIAVLGAPGESVDEAIAAAGASDAASHPVEEAQDDATADAASAAPRPAEAADAPQAAARGGVDASVNPGLGDGSDDAASRGGRIFATPLVRRLARERDIDLATITGTGPNGRIVRRDLDGAITAAPEPAQPAAVPAERYTDAQFTDTPHTGMRRAIARRLTESKTTVPHFYLVAHCRVDALFELRRQINAAHAAKVSVNDLVVKAVATALREVPEANAIWMPDATRQFSSVDIAVAVSVDGGLLTPVVRGVDRMPLSELSAAIRDLADRARAGRIKQHELEGGSFSVSNLGMYGTSEFSAILNPPHAGILAVGAAEKRPVVGADDALEVATMMTVTLSADHRVLDGALAAQWLAAFQRRIENPVSILI